MQTNPEQQTEAYTLVSSRIPFTGTAQESGHSLSEHRSFISMYNKTMDNTPLLQFMI